MRRIRAHVENDIQLDSYFAPCSWICTQRDNVNTPGDLFCVNFTEFHGGDPVETFYSRCTGSQLHTWGGYVRVADVKPLVSMREMDPDWRGRHTSGSKAQRERAKTPLTEAERRGERTTRAEAADLVLNPDLVSVEETVAVLASREGVRRSRRTNVLSRYARTHRAVQDDPYHWPCSLCYYDFTDENNVFTDLLNFGSADRSFKCSSPTH